MEKKAILQFPIDANISMQATVSNIEFSSQDIGSAVLAFRVTKGKEAYDLGGATATVTIITKDKSRFDSSASVTDSAGGIVEYVLPENVLKHPGTAQGQLVIQKDDVKIAGIKFSFKIDQALADRDLETIREVYVESIESIVADIRETAESIKDFDVARIDTELRSVNTQLVEKANKTEVEEINTVIESKADKTAVEEISTAIESKADKTEIESINTVIQDKADKAELEQVSAELASMPTKADLERIGSAAPKGTYATVSALQNAFPNGSTGIYVVTADGKWYYWNGTAWTAGGQYQSTGIADGAVSIRKTDFIIPGKNMIDEAKKTDGRVNHINGRVETASGYKATDYTEISPASNLVFTSFSSLFAPLANGILYGAYYDENNNYISGISSPHNIGLTVIDEYSWALIIPANARYVRLSLNQGARLFQLESGTARTSYERFQIKLKNGVEVPEIFPSEKRTPIGSTGYLVTSPSAKLPDINTVNKTLTLYNNFYVYHNKSRYSFSSPITLTFLDIFSIQYLIFDVSSKTFRIDTTTDSNSKLTENDILLGVFTFTENYGSKFTVKDVQVGFNYTINGESRLSEAVAEKPYVFAPELLIGDYTPIGTKAADGSDSTAEFNFNTTKASDVYAKFDELVTKYPNYIKRTLLGNDSSGTLPIYKYEFFPEVLEEKPNFKGLPKIILGAGIHGGGLGGDNPTSVYALHYFMKNICDNWKESSVLEYMRFNIRFVVVPIQNPWGFDNNNRHNSNDVDLNRNWDWNWTTGENRGTSAFSEVETQYIRDLALANKDAIYLGDIHTTGGTDEFRYDQTIIWHSLNDKGIMHYIAKSHAGKISRMWKGKHGLSNQQWYSTLTYSDNVPYLKSWVENVAKIPSSTFEVAPRINSQSRNNATIIYMMTEALGNWVVQIIKFYQNK